jgi:hypothetical protein
MASSSSPQNNNGTREKLKWSRVQHVDQNGPPTDCENAGKSQSGEAASI